MTEKLAKLAEYAERSYWENRNFIDGHVTDWCRGDDRPSYPFLRIARALRQLAKMGKGSENSAR